MYSGSTITNYSGSILGAHQKVDRIARDALSDYLTDDSAFPPKKLILRFEGKKGPDGMKSKSAGVENEPWHFFDPFDPDDGDLIEHLNEHFNNLSVELKNKNKEKAAFEAAWLAHTILDGLTPSHHYPYERELERIRGESKETRDTIYKKIVVPGPTVFAMAMNNWEMWGAKGLFTTHALFEWGAATLMITLPKKVAYPSRYEIKKIEQIGFIEYYKRISREVAILDMYEHFYRRGWSPSLSKEIRHELAPRMASTVTLAWYLCAKEAGIASAEV